MRWIAKLKFEWLDLRKSRKKGQTRPRAKTSLRNKADVARLPTHARQKDRTGIAHGKLTAERRMSDLPDRRTDLWKSVEFMAVRQSLGDSACFLRSIRAVRRRSAY